MDGGPALPHQSLLHSTRVGRQTGWRGAEEAGVADLPQRPQPQGQALMRREKPRDSRERLTLPLKLPAAFVKLLNLPS